MVVKPAFTWVPSVCTVPTMTAAMRGNEQAVLDTGGAVLVCNEGLVQVGHVRGSLVWRWDEDDAARLGGGGVRR